MGYVPGKNNMVADVLSRFAYPAQRHIGTFPNMGPCKMRKNWRASFHGSEWRKGVVCTFVLVRRVMWSRLPGGSNERWQCHTPLSDE